MTKQKSDQLEDMFLWSSDSLTTYVRSLHDHIQSLYEENDNLQEIIEECNEEIDGKAIKIKSILETNEKLAAQVLELKAQLHDLLR